MLSYQRMLLHRLADCFGLVHESVGEGDNRHITIERCEESGTRSCLRGLYLHSSRLSPTWIETLWEHQSLHCIAAGKRSLGTALVCEIRGVCRTKEFPFHWYMEAQYSYKSCAWNCPAEAQIFPKAIGKLRRRSQVRLTAHRVHLRHSRDKDFVGFRQWRLEWNL